MQKMKRFSYEKILAENGFPLSFPEEVIEESERIPEYIAATEIQKRKGLS